MAVLHVAGGITFGPLRHLVRRVLGGSGVGHDVGWKAVSVGLLDLYMVLFVCLSVVIVAAGQELELIARMSRRRGNRARERLACWWSLMQVRRVVR